MVQGGVLSCYGSLKAEVEELSLAEESLTRHLLLLLTSYKGQCSASNIHWIWIRIQGYIINFEEEKIIIENKFREKLFSLKSNIFYSKL